MSAVRLTGARPVTHPDPRGHMAPGPEPLDAWHARPDTAGWAYLYDTRCWQLDLDAGETAVVPPWGATMETYDGPCSGSSVIELEPGATIRMVRVGSPDRPTAIEVYVPDE